MFGTNSAPSSQENHRLPSVSVCLTLRFFAFITYLIPLHKKKKTDALFTKQSTTHAKVSCVFLQQKNTVIIAPALFRGRCGLMLYVE